MDCANCGSQLTPGAKFCAACGAPVPEDRGCGERRKLATILFADIAGSTAMGESLDPEAVRRLLTGHFAAIRTVIERHGGTIEKFIGDAVMAVFGVPQTHEDDALRAVRAALDLQVALQDANAAANATVAMRVGVNTGEVVAGEEGSGETLVTGDTVNTAARLEQAAEPGTILIGPATYRLVTDAVVAEPVASLVLKGKAEPVPAYRLTGLKSGEGRRRHLEARLVGRQPEMMKLRQAWEAVHTDRIPRLLTVVAPAGVGKSRLVHELVSEVEDAGRVLLSRCLPYGDGITYWPIRGLLLGAAGVDEADAVEVAREKVSDLLAEAPDGPKMTELVNGAIGLAEISAAQDELFWAIRRSLETIAAEPTLIVVEDLHWAEPTLLDLLQYTVDLAAAPILLVATTRPELIESRPEWAAMGARASLLRLDAMTGSEGDELLDAQAGGEAVPKNFRRRILDAAEGNPLFIEEMVAMLREDGLLLLHDGGWRAAGEALGSVEVPTSIRALLAARLDRLPNEERTVAERASVVGRTFEAAAVSELAPATLRSELGRHLLALVRKELLHPDRGDLTPGDAFRFRHVLIRDAAYEMLPKAERAALHERFAGWLDRAAGDRLMEFEEILAYHLEQAARYQRELGLDDEETRRTAARAGQLLTVSGQRALALNAISAAHGLFRRARVLLQADSPQRIDVYLGLADVAGQTGDFGEMHRLLDEATNAATRAGDPRIEARTALVGARIRSADAPDGWVASSVDLIDRARPAAEADGDVELQAMAWALEADVMWLVGQLGRAASASTRTRDLSKQLARPPLGRLDDYVPTSIAEGSMPVAEGIRELEALADDPGLSQSDLSEVLDALGLLRAMLGEFDAARDYVGRASEILRQLGRDVLAVTADANRLGQVELYAGDVVAAERVILTGYRELQRMGEDMFRSTLAGMLAIVVADLGRFEEAAAYADEAADASLAEDVVSQVLIHRARAKILAGRGDREEAIRSAREAVGLADPTDNLILRGDALVDLARVLWSAGRADEARDALAGAVSVYEQKGSVVSVRQARELQADFAAGS